MADNGTPPANVQRKQKKKKEKKKKLSKEERKKLRAEEAAKRAAAAAAGDIDMFGDLPMIQSSKITDRVWTSVSDLNTDLADTTVLVRARLHKVRVQSRFVFMELRQACQTVQGVLMQGKGVSKAMFKYVTSITRESIVEVEATVCVPPEPIKGCSIQGVELSVRKMWTVSKAAPVMPFDIADASVVYDKAAAAAAEAAGAGSGGKKEEEGEEGKRGMVKQDLRLEHRWIDLRVTAHNAIMRISSGVCTLFREFLLKKNFVEIQTPKLLPGASEGGAEVFTLDYFGRTACLAQSPQLYKQCVAANSDFERVFEIGPVFRAENSNTNRHLCEFHGMDLEMNINEHYFEALDMFSGLFIYIFDNLKKRYSRELEAVRRQYPFEDLQYLRPSLRLTHAEGISLLQQAGWADADPNGDLTTPQEKALGKIVKEKFGTDFFMMDRYPMAARPFYTMPAPDDPNFSNSYDMFIRGEEILSGAQRVHDPKLLRERAIATGVPPESIQWYIDSFKHGSTPHAGGGIGLERVVFLYLGLPNIRLATMFTRDPRRIAP